MSKQKLKLYPLKMFDLPEDVDDFLAKTFNIDEGLDFIMTHTNINELNLTDSNTKGRSVYTTSCVSCGINGISCSIETNTARSV